MKQLSERYRMDLSNKKWPGIAIPEEDRDLINRIGHQSGVLQDIDNKDMLMIAASIAVKSNAGPVPPPTTRRIDTISPGNLNSYREFKQYVALIYYLTAGKGNLNSMSDPKIMIDNFIDYARRGLQVLKITYLESPDGGNKLEEEFIEYLDTAVSKS